MNDNHRWQLECFGPLLRVHLRRLRRDPQLRGFFDSSDIVQETLLRAHKNLPMFRGQSEGELVKWMKTILANLHKDLLDYIHAIERDPNRVIHIKAAFAESSACIEKWAVDKQPTPSQQVVQKEAQLKVLAAIENLPPEQRDVVIQRDLEGLKVAVIADNLGKSAKAVSGLLDRGRQKLRELLAEFK
jgi:RNA polymerase sigma-70 factor (ECF subfamily)